MGKASPRGGTRLLHRRKFRKARSAGHRRDRFRGLVAREGGYNALRIELLNPGSWQEPSLCGAARLVDRGSGGVSHRGAPYSERSQELVGASFKSEFSVRKLPTSVTAPIHPIWLLSRPSSLPLHSPVLGGQRALPTRGGRVERFANWPSGALAQLQSHHTGPVIGDNRNLRTEERADADQVGSSEGTPV